MKTSLVSFYIPSALTVSSTARFWSEGLQISVEISNIIKSYLFIEALFLLAFALLTWPMRLVCNLHIYADFGQAT